MAQINQENTSFFTKSSGNVRTTDRTRFFRNLSSLFGFRKKTSKTRGFKKHDIEFVKVDPDSEMRQVHAKIGRIFSTKMSTRLEKLFDAWLTDTTDTYVTLKDRAQRLAQLEFAVMNDPFLGMAADLYADEATQVDEIVGQLIDIDVADLRMKQRMNALLEQWGITQNRVRSAIYNMVIYGDAFWANKITEHGVIRITPLDVHQVKERLEFNPARVAGDLALRAGDLFTTMQSRDAKLKLLLDTIESEENEEFSDIFDTKLFGFVLEDDLIAPPWNITHFRLNAEQSPFYPFGNPVFLKALAPFRQLNATMVLQSLARVMSFPITVYEVETAPGMDEAQRFERVNEVREEYENIGESSAGSDAYSVNTKLWIPKGLISLNMHTPSVDLNAVGDIEMLQDRVAVASGIPKGYLVQEWGGFGNSALSLVEQWKPFGRKVFTAQSAFLEGLSNLFRLHFAITGEFDYREPFILSLKFPGGESAEEALNAKKSSLDLTQKVLDIISNVIGAVGDPLPLEVIKDVFTKFSFLSPKDIEKWIKPGAKKKTGPNSLASAPDAEDWDTGSSTSFSLGNDFSNDLSDETVDLTGGVDLSPAGEEPVESETPEIPSETSSEEENVSKEPPTEEPPTTEQTFHLTHKNKSLREKILIERFKQSRQIIYEHIIEAFKASEEILINNRHFKYSSIPSWLEPSLKTLEIFRKDPARAEKLQEKTLSWGKIKEEVKINNDVLEKSIKLDDMLEEN